MFNRKLLELLVCPVSKAPLVYRHPCVLQCPLNILFPGVRPGRPLSENTHAKLLRELGFEAVTHGFRSSFRDYAAEQTHAPHAVMEAALAHTIKNKAEAAYARRDLFEKRREPMESWARYLGA